LVGVGCEMTDQGLSSGTTSGTAAWGEPSVETVRLAHMQLVKISQRRRSLKWRSDEGDRLVRFEPAEKRRHECELVAHDDLRCGNSRRWASTPEKSNVAWQRTELPLNQAIFTRGTETGVDDQKIVPAFGSASATSTGASRTLKHSANIEHGHARRFIRGFFRPLLDPIRGPASRNHVQENDSRSYASDKLEQGRRTL
jgi:hypothetical protein